jgi:endonuclease/exonuclease/phosphatase family metal-dependent hydrolase
MNHRILVSNIGYARNIDGSVLAHLRQSRHHLRTSVRSQKIALDAYKNIIAAVQPDICCMIEIDTGSPTSSGFDQFAYLLHPDYPLRDVVGKYAVSSRLSKFWLTRGKSNGFMAKRPYRFNRYYLSHGSKRLLYRIELEKGLVLFFTHLSLNSQTRLKQIQELRAFADKETGDVLIAGDFNILAGPDELKTFTRDGRYTLLNDSALGTFTLLGRHYLLDICLATSHTVPRTSIEVIDQPFSDHDALLITVEGQSVD